MEAAVGRLEEEAERRLAEHIAAASKTAEALLKASAQSVEEAIQAAGGARRGDDPAPRPVSGAPTAGGPAPSPKAAGEPADERKADSDAILRIETALAKASLTRVQRRDPHNTYHMMTVGELGQQLFLQSNTLTPMLKRLETLGYIKRSRDSADVRQVRINLTEPGRRLHLRASDIVRSVRDATRLQDRQVKALTKEVDALRKALESQNSR